MVFVDEIILHMQAGSGGDGAVKWFRNRRMAKGGPAGGNGGRGGDVYVVGVRDITRLAKYKSNPNFRAEDGTPGGGNSLEGRNGNDEEVRVPVGSIITNLTTGEVFDVTNDGERYKVLTGGKGGYGNEHFKSSRNVTPMEHTEGKLGEKASFKVELRMIADAGLIGYPNAGKSTLLNSLTNSNAKIGNYPFTTLDPNLGVFNGYILADIPGLIDGASQGKGLGTRFLRHIMRTKLILHVISVERDDVVNAYLGIRDELRTYNKDLLAKEEVVILSKIDLIDSGDLRKKINDLKRVFSGRVLTVTVNDNSSINALADNLLSILKRK